jgi:hypothetical protein
VNGMDTGAAHDVPFVGRFQTKRFRISYSMGIPSNSETLGFLKISHL